MPAVWGVAVRVREPTVNGLRFRAVRPAEVPFVAAQSLAAFGGSADEQDHVEERFRAALEAGELWGIDADGILVGHCRLLEVEHYFGGRPVRCLDIAGVAVAIERRRQGIATSLMESAAAWGAHRGIAMSLLFPGVPSLYRRLGWEHAGTFPRYTVSDLVAPRAEPMRSALPDDWPAIEACYDRYASSLNGPGRRRPARWAALRHAQSCSVLDGGDGIEAYVLQYRGAEPGESPSAPPTVDWAATTPRGLRAVVAMLASDTVDAAAMVRAPEPGAWAPWTDSWNVPHGGGLFWMARPLVLANAIAARGFPTPVSASVTFAVDDRLVTESCGPWRLETADGRGVLSPSRDAAVLMDACAVGPLFTGFRTAHELARVGLLDGASDDLDVLTAMFAGSAPVALDFF